MPEPLKVKTLQNKTAECLICGQIFSSRGKASYHLSKIHVKENSKQCKECKKVYGNVSALRLHVKHEHQLKPQYKCELCYKIFKYKHNMRSHFEQIHLGITLPCSDCHKQFKCHEAYIKHLKHQHK